MLKRKRLTAGMLALWMLAFGRLSGCAKEEKKESAAAKPPLQRKRVRKRERRRRKRRRPPIRSYTGFPPLPRGFSIPFSQTVSMMMRFARWSTALFLN